MTTVADRIARTIASDIGARPEQVEATVAMLDSGDTVPFVARYRNCLLYTSPSPRDQRGSRMPSSA